jgi:hypothetical protein
VKLEVLPRLSAAPDFGVTEVFKGFSVDAGERPSFACL